MNPELSTVANRVEVQINQGSLAIPAQIRRAVVATLAKGQEDNIARPDLLQSSIATAPATVSSVSEAIGSVKLRVDSVRLLDPELGKAISRIPLPVVGVPRDQIKAPISSNAEPNDQILYEDAANA